MKIAFIDVTTTVFFGGIQTAVWELARTLADMGHQITIYGGAGPIRPELGGRAIEVRTYAYTTRDRFPNLGTRFRKLAERLSFARQARHDVIAAGHDWVILTKPFDFFWPRLMPTGHRTRFAFMSGGTDFFRGDRRLASRIDAFVACSHFNAQQNYSRFKRPVRVMFNGVDVEAFRPECRDAEFRAAQGFLPDDIVFVFAGRVVGLKGVAIPVQALASPCLAGRPVKMLVIGDGDALPGLKVLAEKLGVAGQVVFHPGVPHKELPKYYASADAGIFPSQGEEAFGIAVAEAMACGLPVVASHSGGMPEVVGNEGGCGELFALGDVEACAQAMLRLAADAGLRQQMGRAARQRIAEKFTWELAARRLLGSLSA
jgi:glycosyltransferase involved in cell wall biosynthesis